MEIDKIKMDHFQNQLLDWYKTNGRYFPWRNKSASNYVKIISEVLLQRTKAETVAKHFPVFIKKYHSWKQLGAASQIELEEILRPLGLYKQRAKRLYSLAQELKKRNGRFPQQRNKVEEMSMMGQYLTNAYELFILKKPSPLLDVNMSRVLERYFGPRNLSDIRYDPYLQNLAKQVVDNTDSVKINWAILDIGSMVCRAHAPKCSECVLNSKCRYHKSLTTR